MGDWTFRVLGEPLALGRDEEHEVVAEIERLRVLIRGIPGDRRVRIDQNPAGLLGEYASLLMEATVRGHPADIVLPHDIRERYHTRQWFVVSVDALTGFAEHWAAARAERSDRAPKHYRR